MTEHQLILEDKTCIKCGLPRFICVCNRLKLGIIKPEIKKQVDDFIYCHTCGCYHYANAHVNKKTRKDFEAKN